MQNKVEDEKFGSERRDSLVVALSAALFIVAVVSSAAVSSQAVLQDPTRPVAYGTTAVSQKTALQLQAVFLDEADTRAVISGRMVRVGDPIASMHVQSIRQNTVRLINGDEVIQLQLRPSILSSPEREE